MAIFLQLLFVLVISLIVVSAVSNPELKFVSVVFRHGDRGPDVNGAERFPNDPYLNDDFFPQGVGGLTNEGKQREYELGETIRTLYGDLLGEIYSPKDIVARSTDYERTKMSLQVVLAAMYPPAEEQQWHPLLNWQPIIADYVTTDQDVLMIPEECPQYLEEFARVKESPEVQQQISEYSEFMKNLSEFTGKEFTLPNDMFNLYHALTAEASLGLELPEWSDDIFPEGLLLNGTILEYDITSYNQKLRRLNGGMLLRNMTVSMQDVINGTNHRKMTLLSGHETNVAALLKTLGLYYPHVPEYGSAIFVELLRDDDDDVNNNYYVKIQYYLGIPSVVVEKTIPGCSSPCPFNDFITLLSEVIPTDDEMICQKKKPADSTDWTGINSVAELINRQLNNL